MNTQSRSKWWLGLAATFWGVVWFVGIPLILCTSFVSTASAAGAAGSSAGLPAQSMVGDFAGFLTTPVMLTLLLFIGLAGVVIELLVPGLIFPGVLGVCAFILYFFGSTIEGLAGPYVWLLFAVGIILMALEVFLPSFGILGLLGAGSLIGGVVMAAWATGHALQKLGIAFVLAAAAVGIVAFVFKERGIWNRFILKDSLTSEAGYNSAVTRYELVGRDAVTLTPLRPSGTVLIDGERIDVVSEGGFIERDKAVVILKTEGGRIVVQEKWHSGLGPIEPI
ncbi:NfeD family protein [Saccharibacillus alkalitolerans]|uniref:Nodulation efficiency protein NfeD n=1 Tax=Saccharibacillus alkalitolerans TaxID=2705290 RepID=A0ABX0EYL4_9BACL|nr:NfeD family protein [Saccharibacillus alkalitolerans]NGZ73836.1 nodulation efficiency protein NfeD [Saccharibacillus alkalitolerans]